jgi:PAS domain S-box-containing protein
LFVIPIVITAYLGGMGPGMLATVLSVVVSYYFMRNSLSGAPIGEPVDFVRLGTLFLAGSLISALGVGRAQIGKIKAVTPAGLFSLERKVRFGFALAAAALVCAGVLTYVSVLRYREDATLVEHTHQVLNALSELMASITSAESSQRGYLITGGQIYMQPYQSAAQTAQDQLHLLHQLTSDNAAQQQALNALEPLVAARLSLLQGGVETRRTDGFQAAESLVDTTQGKNLQDGIHALVGTMQNEENRLMLERQTSAQQSSVMTRTAIVTGSMLALSLLAIALFYVGQDFARSRRAEEDLVRARDHLETRVKERTEDVIKSGVALRAGEERMARVIDSAMDAILSIDENQIITMFNPAAERMFSCPSRDAIGSPLERFLPVRFRRPHATHVAAYSQHGVTRRTMGGLTPLSGLRTNGEEFPIEATISQVDVNGRKMFTAIVRDVSESSATREATSRLAAIVESSEDAIISKTLDGVITSWNPAAERLLGYTAAEALGQRMSAFFPADRLEEEQDILRRIARGETIDHFESQRIRKGGELIDVAVTISPIRDSSGRIIGASKIARDITERKRAEEELREQASLLDVAPVLVRDLENRIVLWTRGAQKIYGFTKEQALGKVSDELLHTEFPAPHAEIQKTLETQGIWEGELSHRRQDGERVVVASHWVLHRDSHGIPVRVLEVNADITALKRAETLQLRSQKLEALGTLAGGIAHDFNNILAAINGSATLAGSQFPPSHPAQTCFVEIEKAGQRAADLVRRILSFSRPQDQNMDVQSLEPIVEEVLRLVRATLPAMVEIRSSSVANLPLVRVDSTQMHQVILNLATNAAHAIGNKVGLIEVKLDAPVVGDDEIQLYSPIPSGPYVRLTLTDNGCGMDAATIERIFDPFFTTKPAGKGTGLGLSVVHGIIAAHHGILKIYSQPEKGTSFQIYFPAVQETAVPVRQTERVAPVGHGEQILLVDDEGVLVFVGTMTLEQKGYRVVGVSSGEAALREFQQCPLAFDAVISDLSMPFMSGLQLAAELRELSRDIPIILTSGYFDPDDQITAQKLGVRATLAKPVNPKELLAVLGEILHERTAHRKTRSA